MSKGSKVFLFILILLCIVWTGWMIVVNMNLKSIKEIDKEITETEIPRAELEEPQVVSKTITVPDEGNENTDINISRKKINIYIIDDKGSNTLPLVSFVDSDSYSPKAVIEAVLLALGEKSFNTKVGKVEEDGNSIKIDLLAEDSLTPFGVVPTMKEELVLNCISYSILDNFSEYQKIFFTVNGEAYRSNNIQLPIDEPFISQ